MFQLYLNKLGEKIKKSFVDGLNNRRSESEKPMKSCENS